MTLPVALLPPLYCFALATYNSPSAPLHLKVQSILRRALLTRFYLPITENPSAKMQKRLEKDKQCYEEFWDISKPLNPHLPAHARIRKTFTQRQEFTHVMVDGKLIEVGYTVIESKSLSKNTQNLVLLLGNMSTLDNTIMYPYPFLENYTWLAKRNSSIPSFRIICISQYGMKQNGKSYMAETLDESGQIFTEVLKNLSKEKGPISQIVGNSIGSIILASSLKHAKNAGALPLNLCFDRGLSSVKERSKLYGFFGRCLLPLIRELGLYINPGRVIQKNLSDRPNQKVYISDVQDDHLFPGKCRLGQSPHLKKPIKGIVKLSFSFPSQMQPYAGQHFLNTGFLSGYYLTPRNENVLRLDETVTGLIMKTLFP